MFDAKQHVIECGDQPNEDLAMCRAKGCGWTLRHPDRNIRVAESYRHLADVIDPPTKGDTECPS